MVTVCKFGGTSVRDGPTLDGVIGSIILANSDRRVNVFSAPGRRYKGDTKVTDLLIQAGESFYDSGQYPNTQLQELQSRFFGIADYFYIQRSFLSPLLDSLSRTVRMEPFGAEPSREEYLDAVKRFGELINSELVAEALRGKGANARVYRPEEIGMVTDSNFGNASLLQASYGRIGDVLNPVLEETDRVVIVPGFYGIDAAGSYTTFQRGGSDITGAILANAVNAGLYENWTDADGILRADPDIIAKPETIERLTFEEAREMAYSGAVVLHPDTLIPLIAKAIPLNVRNTGNIGHNGTYISPAKPQNGRVVEGIAYKGGFALMHVAGTGINDKLGYLADVAGIFRDSKVSIDQVTSGIDSLTFAVSVNGDPKKLESVRRSLLEKGLARENEIKIEHDIALVCVVGNGMRNTPGIYRGVGQALETNGINIIMDFQSERSIALAVENRSAVPAVQALYKHYFANGRS